MPEFPDFDQIAQELIYNAAMVVGATEAGTDCQPARRRIKELLRSIWNLRGAADADLLRRALVCVEAHAEEYPDARPLAVEIARHLDKADA